MGVQETNHPQPLVWGWFDRSICCYLLSAR